MGSLISLSLCLLIIVQIGVSDAFKVAYPNLQGWQTFLRPASSTSQRTITPEFDTFIEQILEKSQINGLSLSIVRKDGVTEYGAWGNRTEDGISMTPTTLFHIASCSKAFLSSAFGILIDDFATGKNTTALPDEVPCLTWETKVKDIVPADLDWSLMDTWAYEKANIRDILSHVSGVPGHEYSLRPNSSADDVARTMKYLRPAHELRQQHSYNNLMFILASRIITHYTGSYTSFVKDRIFAPLNMSATTYSPSEAMASGKMTQAWTKHGRRIPPWFTDEMIELNAGPGGVISSVEDMAKWVTMFLNDGVDPVSNKTILSRSIIEETTKAYGIVSGSPKDVTRSITGYGMGWGRSSYKGHDSIRHSGGNPGFESLVTFLPSDGIGIVVLINAFDKGDDTEKVTNRVMDIILGVGDKHHMFSESVIEKNIHHHDPRNDTIPQTMAKYAGTYYNPGYGSITLCDTLNSLKSSYCDKVIAEFAAFDSKKLKLDERPRLLAMWSRLWSSHVRIVHDRQDGHRCHFEMTTLFPEGYGKDQTPFETFESGIGDFPAEFVLENGIVVGMGFFGTPGDLTTQRPKTVQGQAEVWFDKIDDSTA